LPRGFSIFGNLRDRAYAALHRATISRPISIGQTFGSERKLASRSRLVGAWVAMSPTASSFRTRCAERRALRLLFAPCRDFHQHRELLRLADRS